MKIRHALVCLLTGSLSFTALANSTPFTAEILNSLERVSSAKVSPDGKSVAYLVRTTDLQANKRRTDIWVTQLENNKATQITSKEVSYSSPKWGKDSSTLYFLSARSGTSQVWKIDSKLGNPQQVTDYAVDVTSFKLSNDNLSLIFSASVFPDCEDFSCTKARHAQNKEKKHTGVVYDKMFVRHWDHWMDKTQSQLFVAQLGKNGITKNKAVVAVSKSVNAGIPSDPFGGEEEYEFSADAKQVYFAAKLQDAQEPISTNFDIYSVAINAPEKPTNLTVDNPAWDTAPTLSNNGTQLAYLAMSRPGFEADKFDVVIRDIKTGNSQIITKDWDRSFASVNFSKDDQSLYLTGNHLGKKALWKLNIKTGDKQLLSDDGSITEVALSDDKIIFAKDTLKSPTQLFVSDLNGANAKQITFNNSEALSKIAFGDYEQFEFKGWNNETVKGFVVKPANFEKGKKYPLAFLIHGGPQGSFGDHFHYRWNPQTYAGQGFVSVMIDFHGSTGYGQAFTDSISQNWGSKPFEDLQKGLAYAVEKYDFIDGNNVCALGASYGGYMINWIAGNWPDRFKCLVNHDGVFDNRMMYYATEELWFTEWENGGPYFNNAAKHEKYNPVNFVENWKTPMLVVQGELDYRIPVTQSLGTFTALQRKGIPSKLLYFPDENHWVLKPANSVQWHNEVNSWLHTYLTPAK